MLKPAEIFHQWENLDWERVQEYVEQMWLLWNCKLHSNKKGLPNSFSHSNGSSFFLLSVNTFSCYPACIIMWLNCSSWFLCMVRWFRHSRCMCMSAITMQCFENVFVYVRTSWNGSALMSWTSFNLWTNFTIVSGSSPNFSNWWCRLDKWFVVINVKNTPLSKDKNFCGASHIHSVNSGGLITCSLQFYWH